MAQKRYTNYKAAVDSFPLGEQNIGLIKPGRFNGFDEMTSVGGLTIKLSHTGTIPKTNNNGIAENNFGAIVMPTGIIIHEFDDITLTVMGDEEVAVENVSRKDLVVCEHNYAEVQGGTTATYFIITGPNTGDIPTLPDPRKQVVVGIIELQTGGTTYGAISWHPSPTPLPGDMSPTVLYEYIQGEILNLVMETNAGRNIGAGTAVYKGKNPDDAVLEFRKLKSDGSLGFDEGELDITIKVNTNWVKKEIGKYNNQREINGSIELVEEDSGKTLLINPQGGTSQVTVEDGLPNYFNIRIIQIGPGVIELVEGNNVTIHYPSGKGLKIQGDKYSARLERKTNLVGTSIFYLTGDIKA